MLQTKFIPVAIDQAYQRRQQDTEGEFYRRIASQSPRSDFEGTTQGLFVAGADGTFYAYTNHRNPDRVRRTIREALEQFQPTTAAIIPAGEPDARYNPRLPAGGLVVRVQAKVLGGYPKTDDKWKQIFQSSMSRDNLWIRADECDAIGRREFPNTLGRRIAQFHLVDNTRGEPTMWRDDEIRNIDIRVSGGTLTGSIHLESADGQRGYQALLRGEIEFEDNSSTRGRIERFDVVARGECWGDGRYTRGAPPGRFPLGISFTLADGTDVADAIPPQGSRGWLRGYLGD